MNNLSFKVSDIAPYEVYFTNTSFAGNNALHLITKNIMVKLGDTNRSDPKYANMSDTEFVACIMDEHFNASDNTDANELCDLSSKLSGHSYDVLKNINDTSENVISPLFNKIQDTTKELFTKANGNTDPNGKAKRNFVELDLKDTFNKYKADAASYAQELCQKYNYDINTLNPRNIISFISSFDTITPITTDNSKLVMQAILEDINISISSDDNNVSIDTNAPDSVDVSKNGEDVPATDGDSQTTHPTNDDATNDDTSDININDKEDNASITITINGEEKEIAEMMVKACFDRSAFEQLKYRIFREDFTSTLDADSLTACIHFVAHPVEDLMDRHCKGKLTKSLRYMLDENIAVLKDYQKAAIMVMDLASKYYGGKLILGSNLLNKNAASELEKKGIDVYTLANDYLRVNHNDNKDDILYASCGHSGVPKEGISIETLVATRPTVEKRLETYTSTLKDNNSTLYQTCYERAIKSVLLDHTDKVTSDYTKFNGDMHPTEFKRLIMSDVLTLADTYKENDANNLEDALLLFHLNVFSNKETVETYKRMSYMTAGMESADNTSMVFAKTIVDTVAEYLVNATIE